MSKLNSDKLYIDNNKLFEEFILYKCSLLKEKIKYVILGSKEDIFMKKFCILMEKCYEKKKFCNIIVKCNQ